MIVDAKAVADFIIARDAAAGEARQRAALQIVCGIDLAAALASVGAEREQKRGRILRALERERLKGLRKHWSYDLNRHIALKQALDRLDGKAAADDNNRTRKTKRRA